MGITKIRGLFVAGLTALLLTGCTSNEPEEDTGMTAGDEMSSMEETGTEVVEETMAEPEVLRPRVTRGKISIPDPSQMVGGTETLQGVFYFDYDQAIVKRGGHSELNKHAEVLANDSMLRVRIEGHADERGTREYNLALGERRANAVRAYLVAQGVSRSQVEVISYGEEKPMNAGHSESSWAQNRRVEVVYR
ncbi:MAG: peptidoglycan-associated lipoprotein Pal [Pseudomonadales bacterium]|jgi:peptidoglycan-associated lipoprotein